MWIKISLVIFLLPGFISTKLDPNAWYYSCQDEALNCPQLASNGTCVGLYNYGKDFDLWTGIQMMSKCPKSCKKFMRREGAKLHPLLVHLFEQVYPPDNSEMYTDQFGYKHPICDLREGFTFEARARLVMSDQNAINYQTLGDDDVGPEKHTAVGFEKTRVPEALWQEIIRHYTTAKEEDWYEEDCSPGLHDCLNITETETECLENKKRSLLHFSTYKDNNYTLDDSIRDTLQPMAEKWAKIKLNMTNIYGIRRYLDGGWMGNHVDHVDTHIISAIINVAQDVREPWPLDIMDHQGKKHKITMEPGDLVWYESARCPHGRISKLQGNSYDNIFLHFHPRWYHLLPKKDIINTNRKTVQARATAEQLKTFFSFNV